MKTVEAVKEFHVAFGQNDDPNPNIPEHMDEAQERLGVFVQVMKDNAEELGRLAKQLGSKPLMRLHLIQEELSELAEAMFEKDLVGALDALTDLTYVVDGTYVALGLDQLKDEAFNEVHSSNMSKLGEDGKPILDGGRVVKGPNYRKPDLASILEKATQ